MYLVSTALNLEFRVFIARTKTQPKTYQTKRHELLKRKILIYERFGISKFTNVDVMGLYISLKAFSFLLIVNCATKVKKLQGPKSIFVNIIDDSRTKGFLGTLLLWVSIGLFLKRRGYVPSISGPGKDYLKMKH